MSAVSCFDSDFLKKLEYLSLVSRRSVQGAVLAQRRTAQLGSGLEFAEHRPYTATEDPRYLDWNVYARLGHLLVKRFQEEQDLHVYLLLDASRSMGLGTPPKFDYARQVTAALAYVGLADLDRVAVTAFAGDLLAEFPLTRGKECILNLLRFLDKLPPQGERTDLARAVASFVHRCRRRGLAVVVSDWFDRAGFERALDLLRHHRFDVHVVQVYDPGEADPQVLGDLELFEVERQTRRKVTVTEAHLRRYRQLFQEFLERLRLYCQRHALGCTQTSTAVPFDDLILRMMRAAGAVA
jgi:uncharacterized protein (DUF58 family)